MKRTTLSLLVGALLFLLTSWHPIDRTIAIPFLDLVDIGNEEEQDLMFASILSEGCECSVEECINGVKFYLNEMQKIRIDAGCDTLPKSSDSASTFFDFTSDEYELAKFKYMLCDAAIRYYKGHNYDWCRDEYFEPQFTTSCDSALADTDLDLEEKTKNYKFEDLENCMKFYISDREQGPLDVDAVIESLVSLGWEGAREDIVQEDEYTIYVPKLEEI